MTTPSSPSATGPIEQADATNPVLQPSFAVTPASSQCPGGNEFPLFSNYHTLDEASHEIRMLTLYPRDEKSPIVCTLEQTRLSEAGDYVALSYCWGTGPADREVVVNGEVVGIRETLWEFLINLRRLGKTFRIWVDFLCINQRDTQERNCQVNLMAGIFQNASALYAWLGPATASSDIAIDYINTTSDRDPSFSPTSDRPSRDLYAALRKVDNLFERGYWSRIWIIQEIVLAKHLRIFAGEQSLEWNRLVYVFPKQPRSFNLPEKRVVSAIWRLRLSQGSKEQLRDLVPNFCFSKCHDPRDRIYGLLGLVEPAECTQVVIDHMSPVLQVCLDNMHLLVEPVFSRPGTRRVYNATALYGIIMAIYQDRHPLGLKRLAEEQRLRSELRAELALEGTIRDCTYTFHTFAAKSHLDSFFQPLTRYNCSEPYALYATKVVSEPRKKCIFFSSNLPRDGDLFVELDFLSCLARRKDGAFGILERTTRLDPSVAGDSPVSQFYPQLPDAKYDFISTPFVSHEFGEIRIRWDVRVNGAALIETARDDITKHVQVHWDLKRFLSAQSSRNPPEYDLCSSASHLKLSQKPDSSNELYDFHTVLRRVFAFKDTIPKAQTNPRDIPEIRAAFQKGVVKLLSRRDRE